jgi:hypothetical protein
MSPELSRTSLSLEREDPITGIASSMELRAPGGSFGKVGDLGKGEEFSLNCASGLGHVPVLTAVVPSNVLSEATRRIVGSVLRMNWFLVIF